MAIKFQVALALRRVAPTAFVLNIMRPFKSQMATSEDKI